MAASTPTKSAQEYLSQAATPGREAGEPTSEIMVLFSIAASLIDIAAELKRRPIS